MKEMRKFVATIQGQRVNVDSLEHLLGLLRAAFDKPFAEVWLYAETGASMCGLTNGQRGWLTYLREEGDAGFSSRDPTYEGDADAVMPFLLSNGQRDEYPVAWTLPIADVLRAFEIMFTTGSRPDGIVWHDDG